MSSIKRSLDSMNANETNGSASKKSKNNNNIYDYTSDKFSTFNGRYTIDSTGPFIVFVEDKRQEEHLGNYHEILFAQRITQINNICIKIAKKDSEKFEIIFKTYEQANSFIDDKVVSSIDENWVAYIPEIALYHIGIVRDIPIQLTGKEIFESLDTTESSRIHKIVRGYKRKSDPNSSENTILRDQDEWVRSNEIKIWCDSEVPESISLFKVTRKVYKFILPLRRCYNCQKFGHNFNSCKHPTRCVKCGDHHDRAHCSNNFYKCANCSEAHMSSDDSCIFYKFHKTVNQVRAKLNYNFQEASKFVLNKYTSEFNSSLGPSYQLLHKNILGNSFDNSIISSPISQITQHSITELDIKQESAALVHKFSTSLLDSIKNFKDQNLIAHLTNLITNTNNKILQDDNQPMITNDHETH